MSLYDDHETGYWAVSEATAQELVGKNIYLHRKQASPSWHGGVIKSFRIEPYEEKDRIVFIYQPALAQKGVTASSTSWGPYVEKLITEDGIHLLHKDPKGLGLWGRVPD